MFNAGNTRRLVSPHSRREIASNFVDISRCLVTSRENELIWWKRKSKDVKSVANHIDLTRKFR